MAEQALPRVLFITRKWPPAIGGMERYSQEFAKAAGEISDLTLYKLAGKATGKTPSGLQIIWFGISTALRLLLKPGQFDKVHGGDLAIWPLIWIARFRNPSAQPTISVHGTDISLAFRSSLSGRLYKFYLKMAIKCLGSTRIIANSRASADLITRLGFKNQVGIIPLRIRPVTGFTIPDSGGADTPYILYVGRLKKQKGCSWFIQNVLGELPKTLSLQVAGPIIEDGEAAELEHPKVKFLGPVFGDELRRLRQQALCIIVPNIDLGPDSFEGFGLTAAEGACDGGVVLAADIFGLRDALISDKTGFLLPAGDPKAWIEKINDIQTWSPKQRGSFIQSAVKAMQAYPNWSDMVRETLDIS